MNKNTGQRPATTARPATTLVNSGRDPASNHGFWRRLSTVIQSGQPMNR